MWSLILLALFSTRTSFGEEDSDSFSYKDANGSPATCFERVKENSVLNISLATLEAAENVDSLQKCKEECCKDEKCSVIIYAEKEAEAGKLDCFLIENCAGSGDSGKDCLYIHDQGITMVGISGEQEELPNFVQLDVPTTAAVPGGTTTSNTTTSPTTKVTTQKVGNDDSDSDDTTNKVTTSGTTSKTTSKTTSHTTGPTENNKDKSDDGAQTTSKTTTSQTTSKTTSVTAANEGAKDENKQTNGPTSKTTTKAVEVNTASGEDGSGSVNGSGIAMQQGGLEVTGGEAGGRDMGGGAIFALILGVMIILVVAGFAGKHFHEQYKRKDYNKIDYINSGLED